MHEMHSFKLTNEKRVALGAMSIATGSANSVNVGLGRKNKAEELLVRITLAQDGNYEVGVFKAGETVAIVNVKG